MVSTQKRSSYSKPHDVLTRRPTASTDNKSRRIAGYNTYDLSKKDALKWGLDHEEECKQAYILHQNKSHTGFVCKQSSLFIHPARPFLCASPDSLIGCQCCGQEFWRWSGTVQDAAAIERDFWLNPHLIFKRNHRYVTQLQMLVTDRLYTDFVV